MIIRDFPIDLVPTYPINQRYPLDKLLFFDIETTGLSADSSYLYLIGCIYYKDGSFHLIQWFSESYKEEIELLQHFQTFIKSYAHIIHFNGTGFDIPYLTKKYASYDMGSPLEGLQSIDLYKKATTMKRFLGLDSYRQKSIEKFLHITREDQATGEELIDVYIQYIGKKQIAKLKQSRDSDLASQATEESNVLLYYLLLHNEDDIKGLVQLCSLFYYSDFYESYHLDPAIFPSISSLHIEEVQVENGYLNIRFQHEKPLPIPHKIESTDITLNLYENQGVLVIHIYQGELRFFHENYKDYFYLPAEDNAIHKSLAQFVEKEYREKAKPKNCYTRKTGIFVKQYKNLLSPAFRHTHQDKSSYVEVHTDSLLQEESLELYTKHILNEILIGKLIQTTSEK